MLIIFFISCWDVYSFIASFLLTSLCIEILVYNCVANRLVLIVTILIIMVL